MYVVIPRVVSMWIEIEPKKWVKGLPFFEVRRDALGVEAWVGRLHIVADRPLPDQRFTIAR